MALPVLNESPVYELKQPSTGEMKRFRPFLVKEQKNLLIASESKDPRQMMNAILNAIQINGKLSTSAVALEIETRLTALGYEAARVELNLVRIRRNGVFN